MERKISKKEARKQGVWGNNLACGINFRGYEGAGVRRCEVSLLVDFSRVESILVPSYPRTSVPPYLWILVRNYQSGRR